MNKYHNVKTTIDGITFDSKKEAVRFCELRLLERAGEISGLQLQPKFLIQEAYIKNGRKVQAIYYIADFSYREKNGRFVVEDVKGQRTHDYLLKKKLIEYRYDFEITEV
jgi:hypothetical protein